MWNMWRMCRSDEWHNACRSPKECETAECTLWPCHMNECNQHATCTGMYRPQTSWKWLCRRHLAASCWWWCRANELQNTHCIAEGSRLWRVMTHHRPSYARDRSMQEKKNTARLQLDQNCRLSTYVTCCLPVTAQPKPAWTMYKHSSLYRNY